MSRASSKRQRSRAQSQASSRASTKPAASVQEPDLQSDVQGNDFGDLGDLADVPPDRRDDVVGVLRALQQPAGGAGSLDDLRGWITTLGRMSGFSREAVMQLCKAVAWCVAAPRTRAGDPSRDSFQQAFVRMGGLRQVVHTMLVHLSDAPVVAACLRVTSAAVQGSPLAAEIMQNEGSNMRLVLRAIERHEADLEVAAVGCELVGHMCAPSPQAGADVAPARAKAHRDSQRHLVEEGALDLVTRILDASLREVNKCVSKAEQLRHEIENHQDDDDDVASARGESEKDKAKTNIARVRNNIRLRQTWAQFSPLEAKAARVQDAALHALLLIATGNVETTRMLAGVLWCLGKDHQTSVAASSVDILQKTAPATAAGPAAAASPKMPVQRRAASNESSKAAVAEFRKKGRAAQEPAKPLMALPTGDERRALTATETLSLCATIIVEVLRCMTSRDRPALAARACRLFTLLAVHQLNLLGQVAEGSTLQKRAMEIKFDVPQDDQRPNAPFALFLPIVTALTFTMRAHQQDAPLLTAALEALVQLRAVALMSAPGGVEAAGAEIRTAWQELLAGAEEAGELRQAGDVLVEALRSTEVANQRLRGFDIDPRELKGDGIRLTPRMQAAASQAMLHASELASDTAAVSWKRKEKAPARTKRQKGGGRTASGSSPPSKSKSVGGGDSSAVASPGAESASKLDHAGGSSVGGDPAKPGGRAPSKGVGNDDGSTDSPTMQQQSRLSVDSSGGTPRRRGPLRRTSSKLSILSSSSRGSRASLARPPSKQGTHTPLEPPDEAQEPAPKPREWVRALGFDSHDNEDFDRVWRKPLTEVLGRSFSTPEIRIQRGVGPPEDSAAPTHGADALDTFMQIEFLQSEPGRLKARCIVQPTNKADQNVWDLRAKELTDAQVASKAVTAELCKDFRKSGYLLPKYGVQVNVRRGQPSSLVKIEEETGGVAAATQGLRR